MWYLLQVRDGVIYEKPKTQDRAREMLQRYTVSIHEIRESLGSRESMRQL